MEYTPLAVPMGIFRQLIAEIIRIRIRAQAPYEKRPIPPIISSPEKNRINRGKPLPSALRIVTAIGSSSTKPTAKFKTRKRTSAPIRPSMPKPM